MFAPLNRFKRLRIQGVNKQGATYLNSIADELPLETSIALDSNDKNIELLSPMSSDNPFDWGLVLHFQTQRFLTAMVT